MVICMKNSLPPFRWRTGDLGCLDKDGFLTVYGRRDNLIITPSGRNINPEWVETALLDEANIAACVVGPIGEPMELSVLLIPSGSCRRLGHESPRAQRSLASSSGRVMACHHMRARRAHL